MIFTDRQTVNESCQKKAHLSVFTDGVPLPFFTVLNFFISEFARLLAIAFGL